MFLNSKTKYQQMFQLLKPRPNPKHKKNKLKMLPLKPLKASLTLLSNLLMNNLSPMLKLNLLPKPNLKRLSQKEKQSLLKKTNDYTSILFIFIQKQPTQN
jgi:hypothetical protein